MRMRAVPGGTVGGRIAFTANPPRCSSLATCSAASFAPRITGTICVATRAARQSRSREPVAQRRRNRAKMRPFRIRRARQRKRRPNLPSEIRRHRRAENKCPRAIDQMLPQRAAAAHKRPRASQRLAARVHDREHVALETNSAATPRPSGPQTPVACASSTITDASYLRASATSASERRDVALHAENALGHDHARAGAVRGIAQRAFKKFQIAMRINDFRRARKPHAVDQGSRDSAHPKKQCRQVAAGNRAPRCSPRTPSQNKAPLQSRKRREFRLDLFPLARIPGKQPRARRSRPSPRAATASITACFSRGSSGKPEVIVRAEIQPGSRRPESRANETAPVRAAIRVRRAMRRSIAPSRCVRHPASPSCPDFRAAVDRSPAGDWA